MIISTTTSVTSTAKLLGCMLCIKLKRPRNSKSSYGTRYASVYRDVRVYDIIIVIERTLWKYQQIDTRFVAQTML